MRPRSIRTPMVLALCLFYVSSSCAHRSNRWQESDEVETIGAGQKLQWPLKGTINLSSDFGWRGFSRHEGIDLSARRGTPVYAAAKGRVVYAGWREGYGRLVIVDHGRYSTYYAHLSKWAVRKNHYLRRGQYLGRVGASGNARGVHLHFEVRRNDGVVFDPKRFLPIQRFVASNR